MHDFYLNYHFFILEKLFVFVCLHYIFNSFFFRLKEINELNSRLLRDKEEEIFDLKSQLNDAKNLKYNNQQLHDALIFDFKKTISVCSAALASLVCLLYVYLKRFNKKKCI